MSSNLLLSTLMLVGCNGNKQNSNSGTHNNSTTIKDVTDEQLMAEIKGPDFPTGGYILGRSGIKSAYENGKGSIIIRSKTDINELPPHYIREVSNFFEVYKLLEDGITAVNGSLNKEGAIRIIKEAIERYDEHFGK